MKKSHINIIMQMIAEFQQLSHGLPVGMNVHGAVSIESDNIMFSAWAGEHKLTVYVNKEGILSKYDDAFFEPTEAMEKLHKITLMELNLYRRAV